MSNGDDYDGLVHSHGWAAEPMPWRETGAAEPEAPRILPHAEAGHDDGLVHEHNWACSERGREAHL